MEYRICADALRWALRNTSYTTFNSLLGKCPKLSQAVHRGGFKLAPNTFRDNNTVQRLVTVINNDLEFARLVMLSTVDATSRISPVLQAYEMLSPDWLAAHWRVLFRTLQDPRPWAAAAFADSSQPRLHRLGELLMGKSAFWKDAPPTTGERAIGAMPSDECRRLHQFPAVLAHLMPAGVAAPADNAARPAAPGLIPLTPASARDSARIGELHQERDQLRKQLRIAEQQHNEAIAAKDKAYAALQGEIGGLRDDLQNALAELAADKDDAVRQQVLNFEALTLGVHPDLETFARLAQQKSVNLKDRVANALQRQRELNRNFGTRQQLRDERRRLDGLLTQVKHAIDEAMQPHPDLAGLQQELEKLIADIDEKLRGEVTEGANSIELLPSRLVEHIKMRPMNASAFVELDRVEEFLASPLGKDILRPDEIAALQEALASRRKLCRQAVAAASAQKPVLENQNLTGSLQVHAQLSWLIDKFPEAEVFVDGYNVIKTDPYWSELEKSVNGFSATRTDFINHCARLAKRFRHLTIVFDSDMVTSTIEHHGNLSIVYVARTTEDQNADNYLVAELARLADEDQERQESHTRWVVTDDLGLRYRLQGVCQAIILNQTFATFAKTC